MSTFHSLLVLVTKHEYVLSSPPILPLLVGGFFLLTLFVVLIMTFMIKTYEREQKFNAMNDKKNKEIKMDKKHFKFDVVSIDYDSVKQEFIDNKDTKSLEKLDKLSFREWDDILWRVDDKFSDMRAELWQEFLYEVCDTIKKQGD